MTTHRAPWRVVFETYPCPTCGAEAGHVCVTTGGRQADLPHAERTRLADRCPVCGVIVADRDDPGALCPRCALVRALETERASTWKRIDP